MHRSEHPALLYVLIRFLRGSIAQHLQVDLGQVRAVKLRLVDVLCSAEQDLPIRDGEVAMATDQHALDVPGGVAAGRPAAGQGVGLQVGHIKNIRHNGPSQTHPLGFLPSRRALMAFGPAAEISLS